MTDLSVKTLHDLLICDYETGLLTWRKRDASLFKDGKYPAKRACKTFNTRFAGKPAFTAIKGGGYLCGIILGEPYLTHRVVYAMAKGYWPNGEIDHINGVKTDNRPVNLRDVNRTANNRNAASRKDNTCGHVGVTFHKPNGKWQARISHRGRRSSLGLFDDINDAIAARKAAEIEHGYHENHGRAALC